MGDIGKRIDRLEEILGDRTCICASLAPIAIVVVEKEWTPEQVDEAKAAQAIVCPVHGPRLPPIMTLSGSDKFG
jgi:hypothetical protein